MLQSWPPRWQRRRLTTARGAGASARRGRRAHLHGARRHRLHRRLDQGPALPLQQAGPRRVLSRHHLQVRPRHRRHQADGDRLGRARADRPPAAGLAQRHLRRRQRRGHGGSRGRAPTRSSAAPTRTSSSSRSACRRSRASTSPPASPRCSCGRITDALQGPRRFASGARPHAPLAGRPPDRPSLADKRRGVRGVSPRPGCRAGALLA